jgi:ADP-ribosylglycohydrolase
MSLQDTAAIAVAVTTIVGSFIGSVRWLVKHYLAELKPNGGSSMNDRLNRLEARVDTILDLLQKR